MKFEAVFPSFNFIDLCPLNYNVLSGHEWQIFDILSYKCKYYYAHILEKN